MLQGNAGVHGGAGFAGDCYNDALLLCSAPGHIGKTLNSQWKGSNVHATEQKWFYALPKIYFVLLKTTLFFPSEVYENPAQMMREFLMNWAESW